MKTRFFALTIGIILISHNLYADDYGTCNSEGTCLWKVENNTLTIYGNGTMDNYNWTGNVAPWRNNSKVVTNIIIDEGIKNIGDHAFYAFSSVDNINIAESVTSIGGRALCLPKLKDITLPKNLSSINGMMFGDSSAKLDTITFSADDETNFNKLSLGWGSVNSATTKTKIICKDCSIEQANQLKNKIKKDYYGANFDDYEIHIIDNNGYKIVMDINGNYQKIYNNDGLLTRQYKYNEDNSYTIYDNLGKILGNYNSDGSRIFKTSYTIQEANEATINSNKKYSIRFTW